MCRIQVELNMSPNINRTDAMSDYGGALKRLQWRQMGAKQTVCLCA